MTVGDDIRRERSRAPIFYLSAALFYFVVLVSLPLVLGAGGCLSPARGQSGGELRVLGVDPTGEEVPTGRQVTVQFDRPVVPLGRMDRDPGEVPVSIEPELPCEWRWLDPSTLSCRLPEAGALAPAQRYRVTVRAGVEALDGARLSDPVVQEFVTVRPAVQTAWFREWRGPTWPVLQLNFNQPVPLEAVETSVHLEAPPTGRRFRVEASPVDPDRAVGREGASWRIEPREELPPGSEVQLVVDAGLRGEGGDETSVERTVALQFHTFPAPRFLGLECIDAEGERVTIEPGERQENACDPLAPRSLRFASPVLAEELAKGLSVEPALTATAGADDPWAEVWSWSRLESPHFAEAVYSVPLPGVLEPRTSYRLQAQATGIRDEFGRPLPTPLDFRFRTGDRRPRAVLTHPLSVLESGVESHLPLVVTNIDRVQVPWTALTTAGIERGTAAFDVEGPRNLAWALPLEVREWLDGRSGALLGELRSTPAGVPGDSQRLFTQVTPFHVHAKLGHRSTTVWVTDLASGEPVPGARVVLVRDDGMALVTAPEVLAEGTTDGDGVARLAGRVEVDPELEARRWLDLERPAERLFVRVERGAELALLPLVQEYGVAPEGPGNGWIPNWPRRRFAHLRTFGTTAQGIYRPGSTVQYKLWVRDEGERRLLPPPGGSWRLELVDPMGNVVERREPIELDAFGAFAGEVELPSPGTMGWHRFRLALLEAPAGVEVAGDERVWEPMQLLVADFTPAPFRVTTEIEGASFEPGEVVAVETRARLHSGGAWRDAQTRVSAVLSPVPYRPPQPALEAFVFESPGAEAITLFQADQSLDDEGNLETEVPLVGSVVEPVVHGRLTVESAVRDDRGKSISARATARFLGRDRLVGIDQPDWLLRSGTPAEVRAVVVDPLAEMPATAPVRLQVEWQEVKASRVKGAGNAYLTRYEREWRTVESCEGTTGSEGEPFRCSFTPEETGLYRLSATVTDRAGRSHTSSLQRWGVGGGAALWETPPGHWLPIEPETTEARVGETARFLIRNPFPGARALVTVERLGVMRHFTRVLEGSTEVLEIEVEPDDVPGFYLSVVVTSPRVEAAPAERGGDFADVDLGKPAFRMGYVRVPVVDPYKEIEVAVTPDRPSYRPRERVRLELQARPRHATDEPEPIQLAVSVLDEAVFDLLLGGRDYFDPYRGFYSLDPLDLENFNLLTRLVGIQSFARKGAATGGDGVGGEALRSLFRFVGYWNPSIVTDAEGRATVEFELPDNLTGWRVLAMAATPSDRFGLGEGGFAVDQPIELRPALPNQVTEGDRFDARFTVVNRTDTPQSLRVEARVDGPAESPGLTTTIADAEPWRRYPLSFPVLATAPGRLDLRISARGDTEGDALQVPLEVGRRVALETAASWGTSAQEGAREAIAFPEELRPDVGSVGVTLSPSVIGSVEGAFAYLADYPYQCWEQRLTRAVMASSFAELRGWLPADSEWPGHEELPAEALADAADFQAPNGGMSYWVAEDVYADPYLSAYTALAFTWLAERGVAPPAGVEERLHDYLDRLLRTDVFPGFYSRGMASSVRAVALAARARSGRASAADVERYRRALPEMDLFGRAHFLLAAERVGAEPLVELARDAILAHADRSAGKVQFTETVDTAHERILHSSLRSDCAVLSALVRSRHEAGDAGGDVEELEEVGELAPRLVRGIVAARERRDHWENTQENVFCTAALSDYAWAFEAEPVDLEVRALLGERRLGRVSFDDVREPAVSLERPLRPRDAGRTETLELVRSGSGRLYWSTRLSWSPRELPEEAADAGISVRRQYSVERDGVWQPLDSPARVERGELVRVDLYLSLPAERNFVVVDDPVPGGLEPVDRDLATASLLDAEAGEFRRSSASFWLERDDWVSFGSSRWSFYHRELGHESVRFHSEWLSPGNYHLSWVGQVIASGEFVAAPTRAEEMYDPDVFGRGRPLVLRAEEVEGGAEQR